MAVSAPFHVYPFDTGGAVAGAFDEQADPHVLLEDYELEPSFEAAAGHIGWAFGSVESYLDGDIKANLHEGIPTYETVTRSFIDIARMGRSGSNQPDKRASAVEIAVSHDVPLKGSILLTVLPKQYLEDSGFVNREFMQMLKDEAIDWRCYDWQPNKTPNEFQQEISGIVKRFFKDRGKIK